MAESHLDERGENFIIWSAGGAAMTDFAISEVSEWGEQEGRRLTEESAESDTAAMLKSLTDQMKTMNEEINTLKWQIEQQKSRIHLLEIGAQE